MNRLCIFSINLYVFFKSGSYHKNRKYVLSSGLRVNNFDAREEIPVVLTQEAKFANHTIRYEDSATFSCFPTRSCQLFAYESRHSAHSVVIIGTFKNDALFGKWWQFHSKNATFPRFSTFSTLRNYHLSQNLRFHITV